MTPEETEAIKNVVKIGVQEGVEPLWEKVRRHDTELALHEQDMRNSRTSAIAQGERLGDVDHWNELGYSETIAQFVKMIETGRSPILFEDSDRIARLLLAARESAATRKRIDLATFGN